ncbi:GntR family transcriptional regulator [Streptomyces sp. TP-A0874]|uniref:GntR family transcriptional regulator n=1 Tax=Streptomyces sp. TP-A0874 TaxID=549819 RepID=UPI000852CBDC|nr:GntR family transcriptional regulator [Streptomyces sp. TP-A0874]
MGTTRVDTAAEPKYWHLKTVLSEALETEFTVGEVLPNERELAARFNVARATLRQALEQLELEGRLQRRRGVGTTVAPPRVGVSVMEERPAWPGADGEAWQTVDCADSTPLPAVARLLGTAAGERVHTVRRTRLSYGVAVAAESLYVPAASVPGLSSIAASGGPARARAVLRELNRLELQGQERSVELGSARADDARQLDRLPGAPVLVVTSRYRSADRTAAVAVATYRADTCRLTFGESGGLVHQQDLAAS